MKPVDLTEICIGVSFRLLGESQFDPARQFRYVRTDGILVDNLYRIEFDASGIATQLNYDPNRQLMQITHGTTGNALLSFGYVYRAEGLLGAITGDHQATHDYDGLKQLVSETDAVVQDAYDAVGNRLWRAAPPVSVAQRDVYDADNRLMSSPADGTTFAYDANGNLLSRTNAGGAVKYTYDGLNRLVRVENAGQAIDYLNDVDGCMLQRIFTDVNGNTSVERFQYANRSMLAILGQNGHVKTLFTCGDEAARSYIRRLQRIHIHSFTCKTPSEASSALSIGTGTTSSGSTTTLGGEALLRANSLVPSDSDTAAAFKIPRRVL